MTPRRKREPFEQLYRRIAREILSKRIHHHQRIPGLTPEEVMSEMMLALWKAHQSYDKRNDQKLTIERYWWSVWRHHKADLLRYLFQPKRDRAKEMLWEGEPDAWYLGTVEMPGDTEWQSTTEFPRLVFRRWPYPVDELQVTPHPPTDDPVEIWVWHLIADGYSRADILAICEISKRRYYNVIDKFKEAWNEQR